MRLTDLIALKQRNDESVPDYIQRFRDVRSRCYRVSLSDSQLTELAFQGLLLVIREKFSSQEFKSLGHLVQKISAYGSQFQEIFKERYQKRITNVQQYSSYSDDELEVGLAEWSRNKKPVSCPWVKNSLETYGFDIIKADTIFYLLLQQG